MLCYAIVSRSTLRTNLLLERGILKERLEHILGISS